MGKRKLQSTLKCFKKRGNKKIKLSLEIDKEKDSIVIDKTYKRLLEKHNEAKNIVEAGKKEYCRIEKEVKKRFNNFIKKEKAWFELYTLKIHHLDKLLKNKDLCFGKFTNESYEIISKNMDDICDLTEDVDKTELESYNKYSKKNAKAHMARKEAKDEYYRVRERLKKEGESLIKKEKYAEHIQKEKMKYLKKVFKTEKLCFGKHNCETYETMSKYLGYILWLTKKIQKEGEYKTSKSKRFIFILKEAHDNGLCELNDEILHNIDELGEL